MSDNTINVRELVEQAEKEGLLVERAHFIRDAVVHIYLNDRRNGAHHAWEVAQALWEAKPSDC